MKNQENRIDDNDVKDEIFQPIEDETNADGNEPLKNKSDSVVHMLPCKIEYDGPAPVNSYFHVTKNKNNIIMEVIVTPNLLWYRILEVGNYSVLK